MHQQNFKAIRGSSPDYPLYYQTPLSYTQIGATVPLQQYAFLFTFVLAYIYDQQYSDTAFIKYALFE
jgi:hypothetical protein